jgi:hypothetical protein
METPMNESEIQIRSDELKSFGRSPDAPRFDRSCDSEVHRRPREGDALCGAGREARVCAARRPGSRGEDVQAVSDRAWRSATAGVPCGTTGREAVHSVSGRTGRATARKERAIISPA